MIMIKIGFFWLLLGAVILGFYFYHKNKQKKGNPRE